MSWSRLQRAGLILIWAVCSASAARAAPASEDTRACVTASTQGQTDRDEGRLLAAREQLLSCAREVCPGIVRKSCADWLSELAGRIPSVVVRVQEADQRDVTRVSVSLDGRSIALDGRPLQLDPGTHTLFVEAPDRPPVERTFLLAEREQGRLLVVELPAPDVAEPVELTPREAEPPTPAPVKPALEHGSAASRGVPTASWVLGGLGVVGIVTFTVLRVELGSELRELERDCSPYCSEAQRDSGKRKALIADLSLGVGVAALAGAGVWTLASWLSQPADARAVSFSLVPTRGGAFASLAARY